MNSSTIRRLHNFEEKVLMTLLTVMVIIVFVEVIARKFFSHGILWAEEATLYLNAWFVILGASYGVRTHAHIGVDAFLKILPSKTARVFGLLAVTCSLIYCTLMLVGSWQYIAKLYSLPLDLQDIPIRRWIANSVLIIGFSLLFIRVFEVGIQIYKGKTIGFGLADEAKESLEMIAPKENDK